MAWYTPIVCSPDGDPMVTIPGGPDARMPSFYALNPKGAITVAPGSAPGLYDMWFTASFTSDSLFGFVVHATRDAKKTARIVRSDMPAQEVYTGTHHDFILAFDHTGQYQRAIELPADYGYHGVAALPDDSFIALAYDRTNGVPRLLLLDSSGQIVRPLVIPEKMEADPKLEAGQSGDLFNRADAESSLGSWLFGTARGKVLLYKARDKTPVLEVGAGGAVREVPLQSPDGYELSGIIPANERWLMWFRKEGIPDNVAVDARPDSGNFVLYEVDPNDGSLRRRIQLPSDAPHEIACVRDGVVNAFSVWTGKWVAATADLPR